MMMKQQICDEILMNSEWRRRELEALKKIFVVNMASAKTAVKTEFLRMCIPYIYAHWEGFIVETFRTVITYINDLHLNSCDVINEIYTFAKKQDYKKLASKQSFSQCCEFNKNVIRQFNSTLYINSTNLSTNSNLNSKQLHIIFSWFAISIDIGSENEVLIDKLVNQRNKIAHGDNGIGVEYKDIEKFILVVIELYDKIFLEVSDYIMNEKFIKI